MPRANLDLLGKLGRLIASKQVPSHPASWSRGDRGGGFRHQGGQREERGCCLPWLGALGQRGAAADHIERDRFRSNWLRKHGKPEGGGQLLWFAGVHVVAKQVKTSV